LLIFNTQNPGEIPEGWRAASGSLMFKRNKRADPGNYRPGRLIAVPGRIMGWVIGDTVSQKLEAKNIIKVVSLVSWMAAPVK